MKRKGLSIPSILTILLTVATLAACAILYAAFRSDADIPMTTMKMAGLLSGAFLNDYQEENENFSVTTVTLAPQPAATPAPTAQTAMITPQPVVTLTLAGMAAFESNVADSVYNKESLNCDYQDVLQQVNNGNTGHIRIAVVPQQMNAQGRQYSDTAAHPSAALALHNAGFNTAVVMGDKVLQNGAQPALETVQALYQNGMTVCGINCPNAGQMTVMEQNGVKIALIGYTQDVSTKTANTLQTTSGNGMLTADNMDELENLILTARSQGCQLVMVYLQWKDENARQVTDNMRSTAKEITAAGADIIVGVGIKRLLPAAWLSTSDEDGVNRRALALYSVGSLLTESREGYDLSGALIHITLQALGNGAEITHLSYEPTYIWKQYRNGKDQYQVIVNAAAPEQMNEAQKEVMERCKSRTDENLKSTLVLIGEE